MMVDNLGDINGSLKETGTDDQCLRHDNALKKPQQSTPTNVLVEQYNNSADGLMYKQGKIHADEDSTKLCRATEELQRCTVSSSRQSRPVRGNAVGSLSKRCLFFCSFFCYVLLRVQLRYRWESRTADIHGRTLDEDEVVCIIQRLKL
ncbi:hypothetical protein J6590_005813 [Homalodisca vitripennis]|nr:hypothetical protein J6590_005813 [Homalodisca vitripennis]